MKRTHNESTLTNTNCNTNLYQNVRGILFTFNFKMFKNSMFALASLHIQTQDEGIVQPLYVMFVVMVCQIGLNEKNFQS